MSEIALLQNMVGQIRTITEGMAIVAVVVLVVVLAVWTFGWIGSMG